MIKKIILWTLVISCMALIFIFSSQEAATSDETSISFIEAFVRFFDFNDSLTESQIVKICDSLNFIIRKCAHFSIYALLGFLIALLLGQYSICGMKQAFLSVFYSCLYACTDEFHQTFVDGRSGEIRDVGIDTMGALCGVIFAIIVITIIKKVKTRSKSDGLSEKV